MSLATTREQLHEQQKWQQFEETWGHLYPKPGDHVGHMIVAHSDYSNQGVIKETFLIGWRGGGTCSSTTTART